MKRMYRFISALAIIAALATACEDDYQKDKVGYNYDITFNEIELRRFTFKIPAEPFTSGDENSGVLTFNVKWANGDIDGGFVLSNKNWRSYPWCYSEDFQGSTASEEIKKEALDSCRFSVFTNRGNSNKTYVVAKVKDDLAYFTLQNPDIVEHILVANTTYDFLLMNYGSYYTAQLDTKTQMYVPFMIKDGVVSTEPALVSNPKIPDTSLKGRFSLPTPDGKPMVRFDGQSTLIQDQKSAEVARKLRAEGAPATKIYDDSTAMRRSVGAGWLKLTIVGYLNGAQVGTVDYYMGAKSNAIAAFPLLNTIKMDWYKVDLSSLGTVDKILFRMDSNEKIAGTNEMRLPPYFCLDGIRLRNRVQ